MKKIAIVGVEGSGKTVMMAAMGEQWERPDERGYFLSPENAEAFGFSKSVMAILRSGRWPNASSLDEMRTLAWSLQRRQGGNLEKIADISMLDYAGEVYRQAFGGEKQEGYDEQVATLRSHVDEADVLIVLVNLSDIISGSMSNRRTRDAMWLTKSVLDYSLEGKSRKPHAAIVFTQADSYREIMSANGGEAATLKKYLPHVANLYGDLPIFTASAINHTVIGADGLPIPASDFNSTGLDGIVNWMIQIGEADRRNGKMREEICKKEKGRVNDKALITDSVPLVHLDVNSHKLQHKCGARLRFFQLILFGMFVLVFAVPACVEYSHSCYYGKRVDILENLLLKCKDGWISETNLVSCGFHKYRGYKDRAYYSNDNGLYLDNLSEVKDGYVREEDVRREHVQYQQCVEGDRHRSIGYLSLFILSLSLFAVFRNWIVRRSREVLRLFNNGKWTEAMDKRRFLFANDGFMLYYHAVCYLFGFGDVAVDNAKAVKLFYKSAKRGVGEALVGLGWMAEKGYGMPQSHERAKQYYDEARSMGAKGVPEINVQNTEKGDAV